MIQDNKTISEIGIRSVDYITLCINANFLIQTIIMWLYFLNVLVLKENTLKYNRGKGIPCLEVYPQVVQKNKSVLLCVCV